MRELFEPTSKYARLGFGIVALLLFIGSLTFFASSLNHRPFYTRGESREALVVRAMFDQDDLITPRRNGDTVPSKPPLFHWMAYGTIQTIGEMSEFAIRFPSALCAALFLTLTFWIVAKERGVYPGVNTAFIMMTAFEFGRSATHARVDSCFAFALGLGTFALYRVARNWIEHQQVHWPWLLTGVAGSVFAVLAKGPAGLLLPWIVFGAYLLVLERKRGVLGFIRSLPLWSFGGAFLAAAALSCVWYFATVLQEGTDFLYVQLFKENLTRLVEVDGESRGHAQPFYYTPVLLFSGFMPWSLMLPVVGIWLWQVRHQLLTKERLLELFFLVWFSVYFFVVTISTSKRSVYLLPAYPAVSFLVAASFERIRFDLYEWVRSRTIIAVALRAAAVVPAAVVGLVVLVHFAGIESALFPFRFMKEKALLDVRDAVSVIAYSPLFLLCCLFTSLLWLYTARSLGRREVRNIVWGCGGGVLLLFFAIDVKVMPKLSERRTAREFMKQVEIAVPDDETLFRYDQDFYSAIYYSGQNLPRITAQEELFKVGDDGELYVLVREDKLDEIAKKVGSSEIVLTSDTLAADGQAKLYLVRALSATSAAKT